MQVTDFRRRSKLMRTSLGWAVLLILLSACASQPVPTLIPPTETATPAPTLTPILTLDDLPITVNPDDFAGTCLKYPAITFNVESLRNYLGRLMSYTFNGEGILVILVDERERELALEEAMRPLNITRTTDMGVRAWCETGDIAALQLAINHAEWLLANATRHDNFVVWYNQFPNLGFDTPAGWAGAIETGQAAVALIQLHALTGDERYRELAGLAANAFGVPVEDGGLLRPLEQGGVFFEEVAYPGAPAGRILNGHMLAVETLAYYADQTGDASAAALVEAGIEGIRSSLDDYDASTITSYALEPLTWSSSPDHYAHDIHLHELFWLYQYTNDPVFLDWALRWQRYKWWSLPASLYYDRISEETFRFERVDAQRHMDVPVTAESLLLDLHQVVPVRSFGYNFAGPYPVAYTVALSADGEQWETVANITDYDKHHGMVMLDDAEARYIRMTLDELVSDYNPVYYSMQDGFYAERLMLGVFRVDSADSWKQPILLLTAGNITTVNSQWLQDNDPTTIRPLPADAVLYGDLRAPALFESITVETPASETAPRQIWLEVSNDLETWTPLIPLGEARQVDLPGTISLPTAAEEYRYFRLGFAGDAPLSVSQITIE